MENKKLNLNKALSRDAHHEGEYVKTQMRARADIPIRLWQEYSETVNGQTIMREDRFMNMMKERFGY